MIPADFIEKKKNGFEHSSIEIREFISAYVKGTLPDYQMAAWLMAVNFQGMTDQETIALVDVMLHSGQTIDLSEIEQFKVDKHSTGGVGDKVSLILAPLAASVGCIVPMISGRSLGHSGGTLDKLESIPGFRVNLSKREFIANVKHHGLSMMGQTGEIVPADQKMYALRDVTSTVKSIPLICGSILSKKIAEGIDGLVLDVKTGSGAFLPEYNTSQKLARQLRKVGQHFGLKVKAVITDMNQPLGRAAGNWLEVLEAIDVLQNRGPEDVKAVTLRLAAWMVVMSEIEKDLEKAERLLQKAISSGKAYEKFLEMVKFQGGDIEVIENPASYPAAKYIHPVVAESEGWVCAINTYLVGMSALVMGAGRREYTDKIKPEVGLLVRKKIGDYVRKGDEIVLLHAPDEVHWQQAQEMILQAYDLCKTRKPAPPLFYETF